MSKEKPNNNRFVQNNSHSLKHRRSASEYSELCNNVSVRIKKVDETLSPYFTSVKQKIIHMAAENIQNAFNYYFNEKIFRTSSRQAEIFLKSSKELISITRFLPNSDQKTTIHEWILQELTDIKDTFADQYRYLKELEINAQNMKKTDLGAQNIW